MIKGEFECLPIAEAAHQRRRLEIAAFISSAIRKYTLSELQIKWRALNGIQWSVTYNLLDLGENSR